MNDGWTLCQCGFDAASFKAWEGLLTLGSGYLHVRGSLEEHLSDAPQNLACQRRAANVTAERLPERKSRWGTFVPGIYGPHPALGNQLVNLPWFLHLVPVVDGQRLDVEHCRISDHQRTLDLGAAVLRRTLCWHTAGGALVELRWERFISLRRPHVCLQRMWLRSDRPVELKLAAGIDADLRTNGHDHWQSLTLRRVGQAGLGCVVKTDGGDMVETVSRLSGHPGPWDYHAEPRRAWLECTVRLPAGGELIVEKRSAVASSRDIDLRSAGQWLMEVGALSFDELLAEHAEAWRRRWQRCDVEIAGHQASQLAIRAAIYHLLRAHADDPRVAIDAKGYAGEAYWGRFFWDTEMFLLPFYLYTDPPRARSLVEFRLNTLDGARRNARRYGYPGARYAWESDPAGDECCPNWQYADHEVHVTADVVYGLAHYLTARGLDLGGVPASSPGDADDPWPADAPRIVELLRETGRYWLARLDRRPGDDHPSLLGVMGPDEYTPISSNNAYTNRLVALNLELAARVAADDEQRRALLAAARGLPLPRADDGVLVLQCEEFELLAEPDFEQLWPDRARPLAAQVPQERLYRTRCLKQADVLMLMMLCEHEFERGELQRAWDYYLPLTTHDSSLSPGVHAVLACRLGLGEQAWRFWQMACAVDIDVEHGGAAEGVHIANAGALWQVVALGFAGLRTAMQTQRLTLEPRLPRQWQALTLHLCWRGVPLRVEITTDSVTIRNRGSAELEACVWGRTRRVPPGGETHWPAGEAG